MTTILMVDDDPILLDLYREILSSDFRVLTANSIATAIHILSSESVDAVGCDYHLNDGLGLEIVAWIATHQPALLVKTILISGDLAPPTNSFDVILLYKPVPIETLLNTFDALFTAKNEGDNSAVHTA